MHPSSRQQLVGFHAENQGLWLSDRHLLVLQSRVQGPVRELPPSAGQWATCKSGPLPPLSHEQADMARDSVCSDTGVTDYATMLVSGHCRMHAPCRALL